MMAHPDFSKLYILHTDESEDALYQEQDGTIRFIAYGSRSFSPARKKYSAINDFNGGAGGGGTSL